MDRVKRVIAIVPLVAVIIVSTAAPVLAHYVYEKFHSWDGPEGKCVIDRSEISDGKDPTQGYSKVTAWTKSKFNTPLGSYDCTQVWERPAGYISTRAVLYRKSDSGNWGACASTVFKYTGSSTSVMDLDKYWSHNCGHRNYATDGGAWTYFNDAWRGGYIWSGSHFL